MTNRLLTTLCVLGELAALMLLCVGCVLRPDHVTCTAKHGESETTGGPRPLRTETNEVSVSATYDLNKR